MSEVHNLNSRKGGGINPILAQPLVALVGSKKIEDMVKKQQAFRSPLAEKQTQQTPRTRAISYEEKGLENPSQIISLDPEDRPSLDEVGIIYVNGMNTNLPEAKENGRRLSDLIGGYGVTLVYNATQGVVKDLGECALGSWGVLTEPVKLLQKALDNHFKEHPKKPVLLVCHSQGAVHTANALANYAPEKRKNVTVVAVCPGIHISPEHAKEVVHLRNASLLRDCVPFINFLSNNKFRNITHALPSHPEEPLFDHSFMSKTYQQMLLLLCNSVIIDGSLYPKKIEGEQV